MADKYSEPVRDPVCGMQITPQTAEATAEYEGHTYYFCSVHCLEKFRSHPEAFPEKSRDAKEQAGRGEDTREYICPMHPEIVQVGPGSCPKCGMDLEPLMVTMDEEESPELADM